MTRGSLRLAGFLTAVTLSGCGLTNEPDPEPQTEAEAGPCLESKRAANEKFTLVEDMLADMQALKDSGQLSPVEPKNTGGLNNRWNLPRPGPGQARFNRLQAKVTEETRLWARIVVNNHECFSPTEVADAQEWLERSAP